MCRLSRPDRYTSSAPQGAANQFEMWLGEFLFVLVLAKSLQML